MPTTTIHLIAPHHTILNDEYSHCAFTGKARRFPKMMHLITESIMGDEPSPKYNIIEYANEGSCSEADEKVVMLNTAEYKQFYKPEKKSPGDQANVDLPGALLFRQRLEAALAERAKVGDICAHIWAAHSPMVKRFPGLIHVETGIGYPQGSFGAYRIFESLAWQHYQWGRVGSHGGVMPGCEIHPQGIDTNTARTWVVPNYFDLDDWPVIGGYGADCSSVVFMSRFVVDKGIVMLARVIKAWFKKHPTSDLRFKCAGMGGYAQWLADSDFTPAEMARIDYVGVVNGRDRAKLLGEARAMLLPSIFVEPFGGAAVEAMLCGTPAITSDFGAFTETVLDGQTGFRCHTVDDYVSAIELAGGLNRGEVAELTRIRYSLEACAALYNGIFEELVTQPYAS